MNGGVPKYVSCLYRGTHKTHRLTFQSNLKARYVTFADVLHNIPRVRLGNSVGERDGEFGSGGPVNVKPGRLGIDNAMALLVPDVGDGVCAASLDAEEAIVTPDRFLQNLRIVCGAVVEIGIKDLPWPLPSKAERKVRHLALDSHDLPLALDLTKGGTGALAPHGDLELVLQKVSAASLVLDACQAQCVLAALR